MDIKKKISETKEYIKATALYELISVSCKFIKNHPVIPSAAILMIFAVGVSTYPIINKMLKDNKATSQSHNNSYESLIKQDIYVTVTGEVVTPGMYQMKTDDRINDAIQKAGGFTENAYIENINLAQKLSDGQYINIISKEYAESINNNGYYNENTEFYGIVNINTASIEELCQLPGIGKSTALNIIEYREQTGGFENIEDIQNVIGIGPSKYEQIKYNITI